MDLFFITYRGRLKDVWNRRRDLHVTGEIVEWDLLAASADAVGGHRWISPDLVLVEAVISEPEGGGRIAEPFKLVTGDPQLLIGFPRRDPIEANKTTTTTTLDHPVDIAYDAFKRAVREREQASSLRSDATQ